MPAAKQGLQDCDPTIAELLKPLGYTSAQIGKNHLGDRNESLPTVHGFDEFYGILYHLNAMEEPYDPEYPKDPEFHARFGPCNIIDTKATDVDDPTEHPRWAGSASRRSPMAVHCLRTPTWTWRHRSTWKTSTRNSFVAHSTS